MKNIFKKKQEVCVYDLAYAPDGLTIDMILQIIKEDKVLLYDSRKLRKKEEEVQTQKLEGNVVNYIKEGSPYQHKDLYAPYILTI